MDFMFITMSPYFLYVCAVVSFLKTDTIYVTGVLEFSVVTSVGNGIRTENICDFCNFFSRHGDLCDCKTSGCFDNQMMCKKQCGTCLPNIWKTARTWPKCYDHTESCKYYKKYGYCKVYYKWMKFLCKYSCGYCAECYDDNVECNAWKSRGLCQQLPEYMLVHCRKSCGVCDCYDHSLYCKVWADNRQCELNPIAMKRKCPLSCGVCASKEYEKPILIINRKNDTDEFEVSTKRPSTKTVTNQSTATRSVISTTRRGTSLSTTTTIPQPTTTQSTTTTTTTKTTTETLKITEATTTEFTFPPQFTTEEPDTTTPLHEHGNRINEKHCGVPEPDVSVGGRYRRIVGGDILKPPNSWPWIVGITKSAHPGRVDCGGSLINNQFVMTAAHCFSSLNKIDPSQYTIRLGEHHLTDVEGFEQFVKIDQIFIHQLYDQTNYDNDIALLRLQKPVAWSSKIRPACLAQHNSRVSPGAICFVAGWGNAKEGIPGPSILKVTKVPIANLNDCILDYGLILETVTERMLCASGDGKGDSCEGDSGGPLVCRRADANFEQIGIVSWGVGCNRKNMYGVYTDVSKQRKWLDAVVERYTR